MRKVNALPDSVEDVATKRSLRQLQTSLNELITELPDLSVAPIDVTGSRADPDDALQNLLTALQSLGLITDSTTA